MWGRLVLLSIRAGHAIYRCCLLPDTQERLENCSLLTMSAESDRVPPDQSPTLHFAACRSLRLDLEMRPWFISVNSRLSVSDGSRSLRFVQLLGPSTSGNTLDFRNIALPGTMSACWSLKCTPRRRDLANHITPWGVDIRRRRPGKNKSPSLHQIWRRAVGDPLTRSRNVR
jgi:hypothetical protein